MNIKWWAWVFAVLLFPTTSTPVDSRDSNTASMSSKQPFIEGKTNQERWKWVSKNIQTLASADQGTAIKLLGLTEKSWTEKKIRLVISETFDNRTKTNSQCLLIVRFENGRVATLTISNFDYAYQQIKDIGPT